jgi:RNA polymerase sigma-70 factor, ECF subfamily
MFAMQQANIMGTSYATTEATGTQREADWALVLRCQGGDIAAYDILVHRYRERLYSVVYNLTSNNDDAMDLTQEAFIKAFQSIHRFKGNSSFYTWIYRIAVNNTLSHLKRHKNRKFLSFDNIDNEASQSDIFEAVASKSRTEKGTLIRELHEKLNEALQKLSLKHRSVVVLFEIEEMSHEQIAEILKCSVGTVRSRLHYAKQQLKVYLKDFVN